MVPFKGKSIASRVTENPRRAKNNFKVYSDLQDENGDKNIMNPVLPVEKGTRRVELAAVGKKVFDEKVKTGRKVLADVSNISKCSSRAGATNTAKTADTTTKPRIQARKSSLFDRGTRQTNFGNLLKGGDENSHKLMGRRDSSVKVKFGQNASANVSNIGNNTSSAEGSNISKTIRVHNRRSLCLSRSAIGQRITNASVSSRKPLMVTSNLVHKKCNDTMNKVDTRDMKFFLGSQKSKGTVQESSGIIGKKTLRKPLVPARKSLPVYGRANMIGSNGIQSNSKISDRGRGKLVNIKVGRKLTTDVSNNVTIIGGLPGKNLEVSAKSSNMKEKMLTNAANTYYNRRQSFTSSLLAKSEVLRECCDVIKKEKLPNIDDKLNELEVAEYVEDIYKYYWVMEAQYPLMSTYMTSQTFITPKMRGILVNWLIEVHLKFGLMPETLFLMVTLFDRFLSIVTIEKNEMQLVGLTALLLASKYEDFWHPKVSDLISISAYSYTRDQMLAMEKLILKKLMFRLNTPTPYVFMLRFLKAAQSDEKLLERLAFYLIELCLTEYEALKFKSSLLCASSIYVARCTLNMSPAWTPLLCKHTHYDESELRDCVDMILNLHKSSGKGQLIVTYEKYMHIDQSSVARIKALNTLPR